MKLNERPLSIAAIACVYVVAGAIGVVSHFKNFDTRAPFPQDIVWAELLSFLAIVSGAFLLRARNWARWLALAWIGFHVILSAFNSVTELVIHSVFCAVIGWVLFRPEAARYFRNVHGAPQP